MDTKKLRKQINEMHINMLNLLEEYEKKNDVSQVENLLDQELCELIVDEDFMNLQSEETLREVDQRIIDEFNLDIKRSNKKALVIVMMDNSGSMGTYEKYISSCVWRQLERLFQYKYPNVQFKFIHHDTEAKEVIRDDFFVKGESGGTIVTSAYRKANELIEAFDYIENDVYALHISDGDNLTSDNDRAVKTLQKLLLKSKFVGYMEINQYNRHSTLMQALKHINDEKFYYYTVRNKDDVYETVMEFAYEMFEE